jgi:D-beta-D-heptose 7-phosphate kinase/D-beta-D-heptose 1-phosphate adenosyltransferase
VGLVGYDDPGRELHQILSQNKGPVDNNLVRSPERATTTKVRYVSEKDDVHILRFDREQTHLADEREQENMLHEAVRWMSVVSALVIEDYGKGVLTGRFLVRLMGAARDRGIPIFVDPKKSYWEHFKACALVKPNLEEAYAALGLKVGGTDVEDIDSVGAKLLLLTRAEAVAITMGNKGIRLYSHRDGTIHSETKPVTAIDVSGAGDTTMAALTLARIAGASWQEALTLANTAAGLAVMKPGTSTVSAEELLSRFGEENA